MEICTVSTQGAESSMTTLRASRHHYSNIDKGKRILPTWLWIDTGNSVPGKGAAKMTREAIDEELPNSVVNQRGNIVCENLNSLFHFSQSY